MNGQQLAIVVVLISPVNNFPVYYVHITKEESEIKADCFEKNIAHVTFALRLKVYLVKYFTFSFHLVITLIDTEI